MRAALLSGLLLLTPVPALLAQTAPPPVPPASSEEQPPVEPVAPPAPTSPVLSEPVPEGTTAVPPDSEGTPPMPPEGEEGGQPPRTREGLLPRLDVYFPEGDLDLRVSRLINKTFFEGQVKYNFVSGDITAFLRYRYYGYRQVTQFTAFDEIEFQEVQDFSNDFDRTRGILTLLQWPHSYHHRSFALFELDRISSNKEGNAEILRLADTNTFVRLGYQIGTPSDSRSNAIVGESRARSGRIFTALQDFGPGDAGLTAAVTYGFPQVIGDFDYVKAELETLKRFDITRRVFLVGRLHAGSFLFKGDRAPEDLRPLRPGEERSPLDFFAIPSGEFFRLDGRDNLKGLKDKQRGTEELHTTWELFFPWFLDADYDFLRLKWQNWYWIVYSGAGTVGIDRNVYTDFDSYIPDVGLGFESSFRLKKYRFFLSGIVAQALKGDGGVEARISVKSYR